MHLFLKHLQKARLLSMFQETLGSRTYDSGEDVVNDALGIAFSGFIGYLAVTVAVHQLVPSGRSCDKQSPLYSSGRLSGNRPDILEHQTAQSSLKRAFSHFHTYIKGGSHHESYLLLHKEAPLIHCITHPIVVNDCANAVLALGARPIMAEHPKEAASIAQIARSPYCQPGKYHRCQGRIHFSGRKCASGCHRSGRHHLQ